ncbi:hypothetical protein HN51_005269 [Arachis hypogaea]
MEEVLGCWMEGAFADEAVLDGVSERVGDVAFEEEIAQHMGMKDDDVEVSYAGNESNNRRTREYIQDTTCSLG